MADHRIATLESCMNDVIRFFERMPDCKDAKQVAHAAEDLHSRLDTVVRDLRSQGGDAHVSDAAYAGFVELSATMLQVRKALNPFWGRPNAERAAKACEDGGKRMFREFTHHFEKAHGNRDRDLLHGALYDYFFKLSEMLEDIPQENMNPISLKNHFLNGLRRMEGPHKNLKSALGKTGAPRAFAA